MRKEMADNLSETSPPAVSTASVIPSPSRNTSTLSITTSAHVGPLPPPEILAEYDRIVPGTADRIIKMAEAEQVHRHSRLQRQIDINTCEYQEHAKAIRRGQWFGFTSVALVIAFGFYCVFSGGDVSGLTAVIGALVFLAASFLKASKSKPEESERK